jgi:hypothetical protein
MYLQLDETVGAEIDDTVAIAHGSFKDLYRGRYKRGAQQGKQCVAKHVRNGSSWLETVYNCQPVVRSEAARIIAKFNAAVTGAQKLVRLNRSTVWRSDDGHIQLLVEPFLEGIERFNSNTGWVPVQQSHACQLAQALSHYSYHETNGQRLLCDIQGNVGRHVVLCDPMLHSRNRAYGPGDMGAPGIATFFHSHKCSRFCSPSWKRPKKTHSFFPVRSGTSMVGEDGMWLVPTAKRASPVDWLDAEHLRMIQSTPL